MSKTITFKPKFEKKLKKLKIKTKFITNVKNYSDDIFHAKEDSLQTRCKNLNKLNTWKEFIAFAFIWHDSPEGCNYWEDIANK